MRYVFESLQEYVDFQRGKDPRKAMDVGMNPLVKEIDSDDLFTVFNITDSQTGEIIPFNEWVSFPIYSDLDEEFQKEIYQRALKYYNLLNPFLEWVGQVDTAEEIRDIEDQAQKEGKYVYDFTPEGNNINVVISTIELPKADKAIDTAEWLETASHMNENIRFERGKDPKRALRIGKQHLIPEITSEDLEAISVIYDSQGEIQSFEDFVDFHGIDEQDLEEAKADYERFQDIMIAIGNDIEIGEYKDWKEFDEVRDYLENNTPEDKPYVYNAFPGGDGIQIVFSAVELPAAEEIDPTDDAFDPD